MWSFDVVLVDPGVKVALSRIPGYQALAFPPSHLADHQKCSQVARMSDQNVTNVWPYSMFSRSRSTQLRHFITSNSIISHSLLWQTLTWWCGSLASVLWCDTPPSHDCILPECVCAPVHCHDVVSLLLPPAKLIIIIQLKEFRNNYSQKILVEIVFTNKHGKAGASSKTPLTMSIDIQLLQTYLTVHSLQDKNRGKWKRWLPFFFFFSLSSIFVA